MKAARETRIRPADMRKGFSRIGGAYFRIDYDRSAYRWIEESHTVVGEFGRFRRDHSRLLAALLYKRRVAAAHRAAPKALNEKRPARGGSGFGRAA